MPFRQYDFECARCGWVHIDLLWADTGVEVPKQAELECPCCEAETLHDRLMSCPAKYTYDKDYFPEVVGGKFDTRGGRQAPPIPELPDDATFDQARDFLTSKHMKETMEARRHVMHENALKRQRWEARQRGENLDLRNCPLPGDPPLERPVAKKKKKKNPNRKRAGSLHRVVGGKFGS